MSDHLLHIVSVEKEGYIEWKLTCEHEPGGRWRCTEQDGTPSPNHDDSECWLESWWSECNAELLGDLGPITTLPIAVRPDDQWDYDNGGSIVRDAPAPNPYRFTVSVTEGGFSRHGFIHVLVETPDEDTTPEHLWFKFPSKDKAQADAALVLAALHNATLEET